MSAEQVKETPNMAEETQDMTTLQSNAIKKSVIALIEDYNQTLPFNKRIGYNFEETSYGFILRLPDPESTDAISQMLEEHGITYERLENANAIRIFVSNEAAKKLAEKAEEFRKNHPELYATLQRISEILRKS